MDTSKVVSMWEGGEELKAAATADPLLAKLLSTHPRASRLQELGEQSRGADHLYPNEWLLIEGKTLALVDRLVIVVECNIEYLYLNLRRWEVEPRECAAGRLRASVADYQPSKFSSVLLHEADVPWVCMSGAVVGDEYVFQYQY
jgi:hypothetical protein